MTPIFAILIALVALLAIIARLKLSAEASRKAIHLGMGGLCLSFPWLFGEAWQVDLLAGIAILSLLLVRWLRLPLGDALHRIQRLSFGELFFPLSVALVFRLSKGDPTFYLTPIAILTFADTAGALIGKTFGKHHYHTNAGRKSLEGSLAVFLTSFLIILALGPSDDLINRILLGLVVATIATLTEGVLGAGLDNLILPPAIFALLLFLIELSPLQLLSRITMLATIGLLLWTVQRRTTLNGGGLLSAAIFAYLAFGLGGPVYLIAPLALFTIHLWTTARSPQLHDLTHSADRILAISLPALVWLTFLVRGEANSATCYLGFCLSLTAQVALLHHVTQQHLQLPPDRFTAMAKAASISGCSGIMLSAPFPCLLVMGGATCLAPMKPAHQVICSFALSLFAFLP